MNNQEILTALANVLESRKQAKSNESYVASLYNQGLNKILEKIGEESTEVLLAAKDLEKNPQEKQATEAVLAETADLWFHTLVMLAKLDLRPEAVLSILADRFDISGHKEKASRHST